jgi:gamma-tubulin complex component 5
MRISYPRTNQFDIVSQLEGLEEKFRVYNEDPLADALKERLHLVKNTETKWAPEILHLLLELSNRPVSKSRLEDLEFLKEPEPTIGPILRWKDLIAENPLLLDKKVWKNVDFGAESSDEDGFEDSRSELSALTETTILSNPDEEYVRPPEEYTVDNRDMEGLEELRDAQFWKKSPSVHGIKLETVKKPITEVQAIREVLFMFLGFPTSLFGSEEPGKISPSKGYALRHVSNDAFQSLIQNIASQGSSILALRLWSKRKQSVPLVQVLQFSITQRIIELDKHLSEMENRYVAPSEDIVVSLRRVQVELEPLLRPLIRLSEMTKRLDGELYAHTFRYLEMLYDQTCVSQMAGDDDMYGFMGIIFFECFRVYLRPMRIWMEEGELSNDDKTFFVSEVAGDSELASLWQSRFKLRRTQNGVLHAPKFLQPSANKIFITGKSVVILKHLNQITSLQESRTSLEPKLDFETVCQPSLLHLPPFSELFEVAFESWVRSKHRHTSATLRKTLFDSCGLHTSLDAISHLYFLADGTTGANLANAIFDKLDTLDTTWNDRFTVTELVQSTFGSLSCIAPERLRASIIPLPRKFENVMASRKSVKSLVAIELKYKLTWPIQTILTQATISSYQRIFIFLLQIRRSAHVLSRQRLVKDSNSTSKYERVLYYSLRTRLLWFTQNLYYYLTSVVIEPNSRSMRTKLKESEDVDTMIRVHDSYIKATIDQALLGIKLELIHKTMLKILDQCIKLEDLQAATVAAAKEAEGEQREMMDMSMASLGLHTPRKLSRASKVIQSIRKPDPDSEDEIDVDLSILSSKYDDGEELYVDKLQEMKEEFDRSVRFVVSGLRGVARASTGEESRCWDVLGEMLESGFGKERGNADWR